MAGAVLDPLDELEDALDDAGVDAATYDPKTLPADLTDDERERIEAAADRPGRPGGGRGASTRSSSRPTTSATPR